ncbi:MAG: site-specific integrase [Phycicoccus sp.]
MTRRKFGAVRRLPSGRYQASFVGPDGQRQAAPSTFSDERDADRWLDRAASDLLSGRWQNDDLGRRTFREYAEEHLSENPSVGRRWAETCRRNMRLHLGLLVDLPVSEITPARVREWHRQALRGPGGRTSIAQSYRLLRAVLNVALDDQAIDRNPCRIKGAGTVKAPERSVATPEQVAALIEAITPRYRAAVVLGAWCSLRRGEVCGLRTTDVDLDAGTVWVRRAWAELLESPEKYEKDPKSDAGTRPVAIPPHVLPIVAEHAARWAGAELFFVDAAGRRLNGATVYRAFVRARGKVGVDVSFHDLRHTGSSLAAAAGASLADLKRRLGHSTSEAALRYMHSVEGRDAEIAAALSRLAADGDGSALPGRV